MSENGSIGVQDTSPDYNYYSQAMQQQNVGNFLQWQFDIEDVVANVIHLLKGDMMDEETGKWFTDETRRLVNDRGIAKLMALFRSHIGKLFLLGNFNEINESQLMFDYVSSICEDLFYHYEEYEIQPQNFEFIKTILEAQALACIRSGDMGFRVRQLVSSYKTTEYLEKAQPQQKHGLMSFLGWGK